MKTLVGLCKGSLPKNCFPVIFQVRNLQKIKSVKPLLGLPPYKARNLRQKLEDANYKDPAVYYKVNIGLPQTTINKKDLIKERKRHLEQLRSNIEFEKNARENKISLCLDEVATDWNQESASNHIKAVAEHYNVFQDLFGDAFFYPNVNVDVTFTDEGGSLVPVYRGNWVKPSQAASAPQFSYSAESDTLWTIAATNPDGHLTEENSEYLHWFMGNIPGSDVSRGETVADYVQPFPARGTGYQRFIFVLYKQTQKINFSSLKLPSNQIDLKTRTFKTYDFYRAHQDQLTPAGLAFCQVDWDLSVSRFFHTVLDRDEPIYEYDFDAPFHPKQKRYPLKQPFNLYMDRYRDPKQIAKEYLLRKLRDRHPFEAPKPPLRFPNAVPLTNDIDQRIFGRPPSWLKREKLKRRLGHGRINDY